MKPEGQYTGIFEKAYGEESSKGTPCVVTKWRLDGPDEEFVYVRTYFSLTKSRETSYAKLGRLGWNGDMDEPAFSVDTVLLNCKHEEWDDNLKDRWDFAFSGEVKPIDQGKSKEISAEFKRYLKNNPITVAKSVLPAANDPSPVHAARDKAWDAFCANKAGNGDDPVQTAREWRAFVAGIFPGVDETTLTAEQFAEVEKNCTPF